MTLRAKAPRPLRWLETPAPPRFATAPSFPTATPQARTSRAGSRSGCRPTPSLGGDHARSTCSATKQIAAAPALWSRIADALDQSSHFILLASPNAAQSKWIKREIRYWLGDQARAPWMAPTSTRPSQSKTGTGGDAADRANGRGHQLGRRRPKSGRLRLEQDKRPSSSALRRVSRRTPVGRLKTVVEREHFAPAFRVATQNLCARWRSWRRQSAASAISVG